MAKFYGVFVAVSVTKCVVCVEVRFCIQEGVLGSCRGQKAPLAHTGGVLGRNLCAKMGSGAYGSESEETVVIGEEPWAHAERNGG